MHAHWDFTVPWPARPPWRDFRQVLVKTKLRTVLLLNNILTVVLGLLMSVMLKGATRLKARRVEPCSNRTGFTFLMDTSCEPFVQ